MITGAAIKLAVRTETGRDPFNKPVYTDEWVTVDDCLVGQPTTDDVAQALDLYGKKAVYKIAIPKGDGHIWEDTLVELPAPMSGVYRTIGFAVGGIEANIPLRWNKKILVERYG